MENSARYPSIDPHGGIVHLQRFEDVRFHMIPQPEQLGGHQRFDDDSRKVLANKIAQQLEGRGLARLVANHAHIEAGGAQLLRCRPRLRAGQHYRSAVTGERRGSHDPPVQKTPSKWFEHRRRPARVAWVAGVEVEIPAPSGAARGNRGGDGTHLASGDSGHNPVGLRHGLAQVHRHGDAEVALERACRLAPSGIIEAACPDAKLRGRVAARHQASAESVGQFPSAKKGDPHSTGMILYLTFGSPRKGGVPLSFVTGIQHVAYDVESPTRQVQFLRAFGLDALYTFNRRGRYITCVGDPTAAPYPDGRPDILLAIFFTPGVSRARLNHICFEVEDVEDAIRRIRKNGIEVDEEDADRIYGPEGLVFQVESKSRPRREFMPGSPKRPEYMPLEDYEQLAKTARDQTRDDQGRHHPYTRVPPMNVGMVRSIEHLAIDVESPTRLAAFLKQAFGLAPLKTFHRRGRYITSIGNPDQPPDGNGRRRSFLPVFFAPWVDRGRVNHICFDVDDVEDAVQKISTGGAVVDQEDADRIYGPEDFVWQIDSRVRPRPEFLPGAKARPEYTPLNQYDPGVIASAKKP